MLERFPKFVNENILCLRHIVIHCPATFVLAKYTMKDTNVFVDFKLKHLVEPILQRHHSPGIRPTLSNKVLLNLHPEGVRILIGADRCVGSDQHIGVRQMDILIHPEVGSPFGTAGYCGGFSNSTNGSTSNHGQVVFHCRSNRLWL